jgi:branched-subunit amino acid transport protein AzlD
MNAQLVTLGTTATLSLSRLPVVSVAPASIVSRVRIRRPPRILTPAQISPAMCVLQVTTARLAPFYLLTARKGHSTTHKAATRVLTAHLALLVIIALERAILTRLVSAQPDTTALVVLLFLRNTRSVLATIPWLQQCRKRRASRAPINQMWGNRIAMTVLLAASARIRG